jgi:hypothetical protein
VEEEWGVGALGGGGGGHRPHLHRLLPTLQFPTQTLEPLLCKLTLPELLRDCKHEAWK